MKITSNLTKAIILVIVCTVFSAAGQLLFKLAAARIVLPLYFVALITNLPLILGFIITLLSGILLLYALKHGDLSLLFPFISLSFIWVALLSILFFGEAIIMIQWIGLAVIMIGVSFVARGAKSA